jgi:hypothetical protein
MSNWSSIFVVCGSSLAHFSLILHGRPRKMASNNGDPASGSAAFIEGKNGDRVANALPATPIFPLAISIMPSANGRHELHSGVSNDEKEKDQ